ncbi:hypothetical protein MICAK_2690039 [Microcystis aeruginosa PCC 9701]|uniref:Uncharacterized protein n=1 Tax=Microcystis aeruginosa PCC 9701 TaxID=721123 RepID=I4IR35_MICAE|nr:hypothetical protein MICAK_2690039 [Microcystis aeruginosa PCC 9701]
MGKFAIHQTTLQFGLYNSGSNFLPTAVCSAKIYKSLYSPPFRFCGFWGVQELEIVQ